MSNQDLLEVMEQTATAVATLTGMKEQFLASGWSKEGAEQAVLALLAQASNNTR